jgi:hypothetical protein
MISLNLNMTDIIDTSHMNHSRKMEVANDIYLDIYLDKHKRTWIT